VVVLSLLQFINAAAPIFKNEVEAASSTAQHVRNTRPRSLPQSCAGPGTDRLAPWQTDALWMEIHGLMLERWNALQQRCCMFLAEGRANPCELQANRQLPVTSCGPPHTPYLSVNFRDGNRRLHVIWTETTIFCPQLPTSIMNVRFLRIDKILQDQAVHPPVPPSLPTQLLHTVPEFVLCQAYTDALNVDSSRQNSV
jgi:hypothetical protein